MLLLLAAVGAAGSATAQQTTAVTLDPTGSGQGTTVVLGADASLLSPSGAPGESLSLALGRGMRIDSASREQLCTARAAARGTCPETARIGFGRFGLIVRGYEPGAVETELAWAIDAYLGEPQRRGDAASVVLISRLLGADLVGALLAPSLGARVPASTTTLGRLVRKASGRYGVELRFDRLPAQLDVKSPITVAPSRLDLSLGAFRRVRQNFTRRIKIRTPTGYEVRKIRDHRLVGHYLFRTPATCNGSWPAELTVGVAGQVKRTSTRIGCTNAAPTGAQS